MTNGVECFLPFWPFVGVLHGKGIGPLRSWWLHTLSLCFLTYRLFFPFVNRQICLFLCNFFYASRALPPPAIGYITIHIYFLLTSWLICIQLWMHQEAALMWFSETSVSSVRSAPPSASFPWAGNPGPLSHTALGAAHFVPQPEPWGVDHVDVTPRLWILGGQERWANEARTELFGGERCCCTQ